MISAIGYYKSTYNVSNLAAVPADTEDYHAVSEKILLEQKEKETETDSLASAGKTEVVPGQKLKAHLNGEDKKVPYGHLAKDGVIEYNGVVFACNERYNRLELGDVSNLNDCIVVALEGGGSLVVNRDNIGDLSKAIGMFSPEDVNRIMRAIHQDAKARQVLAEIEDEENSVGQETAAGEQAAVENEASDTVTEEGNITDRQTEAEDLSVTQRKRREALERE